MEDLISQIAKSAGMSESLARQAVGILLKFLNNAGPQGAVHKLLAAMPGADTLIKEQGEAGASSLFGGFKDMMGGGMGAMAALGEMSNAGLDMRQAHIATTKLVQYAREQAGDELVNEVVRAIPGLSQFT